MTADVSVSLAGLCGLSAGASVVVGLLVATGPALVVSVGMLCLLSLALLSPAGPTVFFEEVTDG